MIPIELTDKHKDKLLEMTEKLFPECIFSWEYEMYGRVLKSDFNDVLAVYDKSNKIHFNTHWFEFCMTQVVDKLILSYRDIGTILKVLNGYNEADEDFYQHPVDYLYKQFQKLQS